MQQIFSWLLSLLIVLLCNVAKTERQQGLAIRTNKENDSTLYFSHFFSRNLLFQKTRRGGGTIGCYMCSSYNYSDPSCHDPFDPAYSVYREKCFQGKDGHTGEFPASYCIKIKGIRTTDGVELVIRRCSLTRLTDLDNKIGLFQWEDHIYDGWLNTCVIDGCNSAQTIHVHPVLFTCWILTTLLLQRLTELS
ncbi:uncharacterized protein LOC135490590 isoform X2 [Lineus longissimus]|uniref:uncharacterized protein LOC135490590 isoform X2 n=1 Tax=Lineus longissimus TaxID=88925 RepID=UPI002B4F4E27